MTPLLMRFLKQMGMLNMFKIWIEDLLRNEPDSESAEQAKEILKEIL